MSNSVKKAKRVRKPEESDLFPPGFDLNAWLKNRPIGPRSFRKKIGPVRQWLQKMVRLTRRFRTIRYVNVLLSRLVNPKTPLGVNSIFADLDVVAATKEIQENGYCSLTIPPPQLKELLASVETQRCLAGFGDVQLRELAFFPERLTEVESAIGESINIAHYDDPEKNIPMVAQIVNDPKLREVVERYLGGPAPKTLTMLWWSFVTQMTSEERLRQAQTVKFHFDELGSNALYFSFYLTDVDEGSGAHVVVKRSHSQKSLRLLLSTATQSDETITEFYGLDSITVLKGKKGTGFIEDPYVYHKATVPMKKSRLFLQIRYYF